MPHRARARAAGLAATLVLHGLLAAAPWRAAREPAADSPAHEPAVLQVMLLSDRVGRGAALLAPPAPAAIGGPHAVPAAPPASAEIPHPPAVLPPDRPALPVTAPDLGPLAAFRTPVAPIRLRLHIDASGRVGEVELLDVSPDDVAFAERLAEILRATPHIPARRGGEDVASTKELRLVFGAAA